jgi:hypothetical protein
MIRRAATLALSFALGVIGTSLHAAERPLSEYARVEVPPAKTSIYVGTVTMTLSSLARVNGAYESTYVAKVFPYFFYNENGKLRIDLGDELLRQIERGEPIEFRGRAVRADGAERRVEGKATPADATSGKLKVHVFYSKRVELIFNTTYRFPDANPITAAPPTH